MKHKETKVKTSMIDGVVGASHEESAEIMEELRNRFENPHFPEISKFEKKKTERDLRIIEDVNKATNELRINAGLEPFDIPAKNIHILRDDGSMSNLLGGVTDTMRGYILIQGADTALQLGKRLFHEVQHAKARNVVQLLPESHEVSPFRQGLEVYPRRQMDRILFPRHEKCYFRELNESVVEENTRRYVIAQWDNPLYADDFAETNLLHNEVLKRGWYKLYLNQNIFQYYLVGDNITCEEFSYKKERAALCTICVGLSQKNRKKLRTADGVLELFSNAMFTGQTFTISCLMEKTFGKGTMRKIGTPD